MIPMVSMKSSTVIPLSAWMFLKTCSAISGLSGGADWATANPAPISMKAVIPMAASIRLDHDFVCPVSLIFAMSLLGVSKNQPAHYNPFFSSTSTHFGGDLALEEQRRTETAIAGGGKCAAPYCIVIVTAEGELPVTRIPMRKINPDDFRVR